MLINGAPGSGKSTLARRYADDHPLTLALDIDVVRAMLGGWLDRPGEAGLCARSLAVAMARVHLSAGRDVVVPQFLGRLDFVLELEQLAQEVGAEFVELALLSSAQEAAERFLRRSRDSAQAVHHDAQSLLDRAGGASELPKMYGRLLDVVANRPGTRRVFTVDGQVDRAYRDALAQINAAATSRD